MKIKNSQIIKISKNRNSGLRFNRQIFGPYDPHIWCYSSEHIAHRKDFADEIKVTYQLT